MSKDDRTERLIDMVLRTREDEIDCDTVLAHAAELVERGIDDDALRARIAHHLSLCAECEEEIKALEEAVGANDGSGS